MEATPQLPGESCRVRSARRLCDFSNVQLLDTLKGSTSRASLLGTARVYAQEPIRDLLSKGGRKVIEIRGEEHYVHSIYGLPNDLQDMTVAEYIDWKKQKAKAANKKKKQKKKTPNVNVGSVIEITDEE